MRGPDLGEWPEGVHLECCVDRGGDVLGWIIRANPEQAFWCGEITLKDLRRLAPQARESLGNDVGWFLVEFDARRGLGDGANILAKVADEESGLRLARGLTSLR